MDVSKYIGLPFKPLGRAVDGCDCWGLARIIYRDEFGIDIPSLQYAAPYDPEELFGVMDDESRHWLPVELGKEKPGDILTLRALNPHVGIVVERGLMIHIQQTTAACIDRYKRSSWKKRIMGIYRHAQLA